MWVKKTRDRRGRDRDSMVVGFTTICAISSYQHLSWELESHSWQGPTRLTTVTRQTGKYKVDLTRHPKFSLAFDELASGCFPHCSNISLRHMSLLSNRLNFLLTVSFIQHFINSTQIM
jgi:hypothetical protein